MQAFSPLGVKFVCVVQSVADFTKEALVLWFDAAVKSPAQVPFLTSALSNSPQSISVHSQQCSAMRVDALDLPSNLDVSYAHDSGHIRMYRLVNF